MQPSESGAGLAVAEITIGFGELVVELQYGAKSTDAVVFYLLILMSIFAIPGPISGIQYC